MRLSERIQENRREEAKVSKRISRENHLPFDIWELRWNMRSPWASWLPKPIRKPPMANPYIELLYNIAGYGP